MTDSDSNELNANDSSLGEFERQLRALRPDDAAMKREETLYRAGWEAAMASRVQAAGSRSASSVLSSRSQAWRFASGMLAGIAATVIVVIGMNNFKAPIAQPTSTEIAKQEPNESDLLASQTAGTEKSSDEVSPPSLKPPVAKRLISFRDQQPHVLIGGSYASRYLQDRIEVPISSSASDPSSQVPRTRDEWMKLFQENLPLN